MAFKSSKSWCDICRDDKPDVVCSEKRCRKGYHLDCLRNTGQYYDENDLANYLCSRCKDDDENESFCYECKSEGADNSTLLMCDGCPRSAHLECLGMKDVPSTDIWMCPCCNPNSTQEKETVKSTLVNISGTRSKLGNVDICYVCQKGGKLLCCDLCDQSFHPKCIDPEFLDPTLFDEGGKWGCPICYGKDPLKNMLHRRLTKIERQQKSDQWQKCILRESRRCRANRNQFLYNCRGVLKHFVSPDTFLRLKKNALAASKFLIRDPGSFASEKRHETQVNKPKKRSVGRGRISDDTTEGSAGETGSENDTSLSQLLDSHHSHQETNDTSATTYPFIESDNKLEPNEALIDHIKNDDNIETLRTAKTSLEKNNSSFDNTTEVSTNTLNNEVVESEDIDKKLSVIYRNDSIMKIAEGIAEKKRLELLRQGVILKPYQRWGVNWLLEAFTNKAGAILADEMGLGKTIQTLAFLSALKVLGISGPHLVVVPLSTVGNWIREIRKFTPSLSVTKICGSRQEREHSMADDVATAGIYDIYISTYETVVTEEWFFTDQFKWQCVILDEAHRIKNESARIRHSLDRVECNMRVLLTGTPLQNNIKELFTLLNFLFPEIIKNWNAIDAAFQPKKKRVVSSSEQTKINFNEEQSLMLGGPNQLDQSKVNALTTLLSKLMMRRTKDLVVQLPDKIDHDIWLPLSPTAGKWYRLLLEITTVDSEDSNCIRKLLGAVIKIRICCCHPRGLVSREPQLKSLINSVTDAGSPNADPEIVSQDAADLKSTESGWNHIKCSSKLLFLDKLLTQLHQENFNYCDDYRDEFLNNRANQLRKAINNRRILLNSCISESQTSRAPLNIEDKINDIRNELDVLKRSPKEGGGLDGLATKENNLTVIPADNPELFVNYMFPSNINEDDVIKYKDTLNNQHTNLIDHDKKKLNLIKPHKVLIFTQFQLVLDELASYCHWRGWTYMRLDGSTNKMIRELDTREFNNPDSTHFIYLISTRAGGLGINLVTANHVVMYDEDWNPFVDLQAVDRAHRIGQTRHVHVWRLMTEWTVEERMAIRRQQKLLLDRMLIQANVENITAAMDSDEVNESNQDKLSRDEVRRLIQYGRTALLEAQFNNELETLSLEGIMQRKRRDLKEVEDEKMKTDSGESVISPSLTNSLVSSPSNEWSSSDTDHIIDHHKTQELITVQDMMALEGNNNDISQSCQQTHTIDDNESEDNTYQMSLSGTQSSMHVFEDDSDATLLTPDGPIGTHRARRERRKPKTVYNPVPRLEKSRVELKIIREKKCFRCGGTGPPAIPLTSTPNTMIKQKTGKTSQQSLQQLNDPLVGCMRCPKVYHQESCLSLDKVPPRSWMCPWHECCLCFRKAGAAGGLLIHCAECPTAFCFDCFPPEYRRYEPPPQFFENMQKRGWLITPKKLVTFLCSKCKALKEQERRRHLSKQQLEVEMKNRKSKDDSARQEARRQQQLSRSERHLAKEQKQKEADEKKLFLEQKKRIDDQDKQAEDQLRLSIEMLYPKRYLEILQIRRQRLIELHSQQKEDITKQENEVLSQEEDHKKNIGCDDTDFKDEQIKHKKIHGQSALPGSSWMTNTGKKRLVIPDRLKPPSDTLKLCDNCHLPMHDVSQCPFPLELIRLKIDPVSSMTDDTPLSCPIKKDIIVTTPTLNTSQSVLKVPTPDYTPVVVVDIPDIDSSPACSPVLQPSGIAQKTGTKHPPATSGTLKIKFKTVCSLCKNSNRVHSRKHCDELTIEEKQEYTERREKYLQLIQSLFKESENDSCPINPPARLAEIWTHPNFDTQTLTDKFLDLCRRQLNYSADIIIQRLLAESNLGQCIPIEEDHSNHKSTSIKTKITPNEHDLHHSPHGIIKYLGTTSGNSSHITPRIIKDKNTEQLPSQNDSHIKPPETIAVASNKKDKVSSLTHSIIQEPVNDCLNVLGDSQTDTIHLLNKKRKLSDSFYIDSNHSEEDVRVPKKGKMILLRQHHPEDKTLSETPITSNLSQLFNSNYFNSDNVSHTSPIHEKLFPYKEESCHSMTSHPLKHQQSSINFPTRELNSSKPRVLIDTTPSIPESTSYHPIPQHSDEFMLALTGDTQTTMSQKQFNMDLCPPLRGHQSYPATDRPKLFSETNSPNLKTLSSWIGTSSIHAPVIVSSTVPTNNQQLSDGPSIITDTKRALEIELDLDSPPYSPYSG